MGTERDCRNKNAFSSIRIMPQEEFPVQELQLSLGLLAATHHVILCWRAGTNYNVITGEAWFQETRPSPSANFDRSRRHFRSALIHRVRYARAVSHTWSIARQESRLLHMSAQRCVRHAHEPDYRAIRWEGPRIVRVLRSRRL